MKTDISFKAHLFGKLANSLPTSSGVITVDEAKDSLKTLQDTLDKLFSPEKAPAVRHDYRKLISSFQKVWTHEHAVREELMGLLKQTISKVDIITYLINCDDSVSLQMQMAPISLVFKLL